MPATDPEPRPLAGTVLFEESDFRALSAAYAGNAEYNAHRLAARRRLLTLGKEVAREAATLGTQLDCRTSLHHPHTFNGNRVNRLWAYLTRPKKERTKLKRLLGSDLGKDLDSAYRNAYLCLAIESDALEVSLRIHADAWYDGQNLKKRIEAEGLQAWFKELDALGGFRLRLADWKGEWNCGSLTPERLEEFLDYYVPGEHQLAIEKRYPAPEENRGAALEEAAAPELARELLRLLGVYRFTVWTEEENFLFRG